MLSARTMSHATGGKRRCRAASGMMVAHVLCCPDVQDLGPDLNRGDTLVPMPPNMDEITEAVISEQFKGAGH